MAVAEAKPQRPGSEPSWAALLARVGGADQSALAQLYDASSPAVFGLTLRILGDRAAAEEVTLDVYTQVWKTASQYTPERGAASSWLLMLARSRSIDRLRSRARRDQDRETPLEAQVTEVADPAPTPEQTSVEAARRQVIQSALGTLDPRQREAIDLAFFSGFSHREIATRLGQPLGTVKTRIRLGMVRLRELLEPHAETV